MFVCSKRLLTDTVARSINCCRCVFGNDGKVTFVVALEDDKQKYDTLKDLFSALTVSQCIIYCNSVSRVKELCEAMVDDGFPVCCIHSDMDME